MTKTFRFIGMVLMAVLVSVSFAACSDEDDNSGAIDNYVGTWICSSPASYISSTLVTAGTSLSITSSGEMTWTIPQGGTYTATMKALGDDWANITYKGKTYSVEIYVSNNTLYINANGAESLKVKDFPFDGSYERSK